MGRDRGLTIRMLIALALALALWLATLAGLGYVLFRTPYWFLALLLLFGFAAEGYERQTRKRRRSRARRVRHNDTPRVKGALQRLALAADVEPPSAVVEAERAPLSWTLWAPGGAPRVHVTTGMLDELDDRQLEAVLAHELAHVVNRDAKLMTFIGVLPSLLLSGLREMIHDYPVRGYLSVLFYGLWFTPSAVLLLATARIVSRYRELAADAAAARFTGSPAAVAGALVSLSEDLAALRDLDMRRAAARADLFHFLPAGPQRRPFATHPPLRKRLDRLEAMERELQG